LSADEHSRITATHVLLKPDKDSMDPSESNGGSRQEPAYVSGWWSSWSRMPVSGFLPENRLWHT
jgi:hypothetical protein